MTTDRARSRAHLIHEPFGSSLPIRRLTRATLVGAFATLAALAQGCGEHSAPEAAVSAPSPLTSLQNGTFSDANGWAAPQYYATIRYPDVNGDGKADVCGRGAAGVWCAVDDGTGKLVDVSSGKPWTTQFKDTDHWSQPQYYATIAYPDVDGDRKADVCGRGIDGIYCLRSTGTGFGNVALQAPAFSDVNGWDQPQFYETIAFADVSGDGRADVCGRGTGGVLSCVVSTGSGFGPVQTWSSDFTDAQGWAAATSSTGLRYADVNGDGKADVCGRKADGVWCALADRQHTPASTFEPIARWSTELTDANGWAAPEYGTTIHYTDVNGDGRADLCARGQAGILCGLSTGTAFGSTSLWTAAFDDAGSWNQPAYYSTLRFEHGVVCGRGALGLYCAYSDQGDRFLNLTLESTNEADANGWAQPQYNSTIDLTPDLKLAERGAAGIFTKKIRPSPDTLSIATVSDAVARRAALVVKVWGSGGSIDTSQGVDSDTVPANFDVPLPAGATVRRYQINMPTAGGSPMPGGTPFVIGFADHYMPSAPTTKLAIVNPGHTCNYDTAPYQDVQMVQDLLADGYAVLATYMPMMNPAQCGPRVTGAAGHDDLFRPGSAFRPKNPAQSPLVYFLDPVRRSLNYALAKYGYTTVDMLGLSGGGWTTTFYSALDPRVTVSVPIAGSEPFYLRNTSDAEQENDALKGNDFFDFIAPSGQNVITGYKDLYVLGAFGAGRRQTQVLNRNDDCCFGQAFYPGGRLPWDQAARAYEREVRQRVQALGQGAYRLEINESDDCVVENNCGKSGGLERHEFSKNTRLAIVLPELDGDDVFVASASPATHDTLFARGAEGDLWEYDTVRGTGTDTGIPIVGTPAVVAGAINGHAFDVFYRDPSNQLGHAYTDGAHWAVASDLPATRIAADPAAYSWASGRIDVVAFLPTYQPSHWTYERSAWQTAAPLGSVRGAGRIAMTGAASTAESYFRALSASLADGGIHHVSSVEGSDSDDSPNAPVPVKGFPSGTDTETNDGSGLGPITRQVFATGVDALLYQGTSVGGGAWSWSSVWSAPQPAGVRVYGSPSAVATATGLGVNVRIDGGQLGYFSSSGNAWSFQNEGGPVMTGSPTAGAIGVYEVDSATQSLWSLGYLGRRTFPGYVNR